MRLLFLFFCFLFSNSLFAQREVIISGNVRGHVGNNLSEVSIYIKDSFYETYTDDNGNYEIRFSTSDSVDIIIVASYKGYFDQMKHLSISSGEEKVVANFNFLNPIVDLEDVLIAGDPEIESVNTTSSESIQYLDILESTTDFDIVTGLTSSSGTQEVEETGELAVRGGEGSETNYFFDGMIVRDQLTTSSGNQGSRFRFSPLLFKNFEFYAGGFSAEYGMSLSSVLLMESEDIPLKEDMSILISPFFVDVTNNFILNKSSSLEANVNVQDFGIYTDLFQPDLNYHSLEKGPVSVNGSLFYKRKNNRNGYLKIFSYGYGATLESKIELLGTEDFEISDVQNRYLFNLATIDFDLDDKSRIEAGISYSYNNDEVGTEVFSVDGERFRESRRRELNGLHGKVKFTRKLFPNFHINAGIEDFFQSVNYFSGDSEKSLTDNLAVVYMEGTAKPLKNWYTSLGARIENSSLMNKSNFAPRASVAYRKTNYDISLSTGVFYQQPELIHFSESVNLGYLKALHYIFSAERTFKQHWFKISFFQKEYRNLLRYSNDLPDVSGNGYAKGGDFILNGRKVLGKYSYKLTYSYLDAQRHYLNFPLEAPVTFAAMHSSNFSINRSFLKDKLALALNYSYNSGRPYFNPNREEVDFHQDKTQPFHDIGGNIFYSIKIKDTPVLFMATLSNLLGEEKIYGYEYSENDFSLRRPVQPLYNSFLFVGCYISLGFDNSKHYIDEFLNN